MKPPVVQRLDMRKFSSVRVTGALIEDAHIAPTTGATPHLLLMLAFEPATGLPYFASLDLGIDPADHVAATAALPNLRSGALVSVGGSALLPCRDHGRDRLRVVGAHALFVFSDPIPPEEQISDVFPNA